MGPLDGFRNVEIEALLKLFGTADALVEGFRPGVMERLGIEPEVVAGPRFSRTKPGDPAPAKERGADTEEILKECEMTLSTGG